MRFSPPGSPLLLVSVLDHQLARKLIADGKSDRETHEEDFHRLITEKVSRDVCTIRLSSAEELINVLRYALRVNSTRCGAAFGSPRTFRATKTTHGCRRSSLRFILATRKDSVIEKLIVQQVNVF